MIAPNWIRNSILRRKNAEPLRNELHSRKLHTICEEAKCPNIGDCFARGTATFLIMGDTCTRNCRFCAVKNGIPKPLDWKEPERIAEEVRNLGLKHTVITSPSRDDLPDGGASFFAMTTKEIKRINPETTVEVLIPDFKGEIDALRKVIDSGIDVLSHNVETIPRLYPRVRPKALYSRSLNLLKEASMYFPSLPIKSGLMLGLGEKKEEVLDVMEDLRRVNCNILTIGQYLRPSRKELPAERYVPPEEFQEFKVLGEKMGFDFVASAPLVRSSYRAKEALSKFRKKR
ncbi:MAG: lipoyl synthase [candidate division WOR-3 bacterium]|nr:lipoyl synthase [candidate division WOR-3 bacterium]